MSNILYIKSYNLASDTKMVRTSLLEGIFIRKDSINFHYHADETLIWIEIPLLSLYYNEISTKPNYSDRLSKLESFLKEVKDWIKFSFQLQHSYNWVCIKVKNVIKFIGLVFSQNVSLNLIWDKFNLLRLLEIRF